MKGKIKALVRDRRFGFITTETGEDIFFHCSDLEGVGFEALSEGVGVEFALEMTLKGPQARNVRPEMPIEPTATLQACVRPYIAQIEQLRQERDEALARVAGLERELGRLEERLRGLLEGQGRGRKSWWERVFGR